MPLQRPKYRVYLNPHPDDTEAGTGQLVEHEVEITHGDNLRGELEANKQGLPSIKEAPMNHTTVWLWCALVRLGLYAGQFQQFKQIDLAGIEPIKDEAGEHAATTVDPTPAAAGTL